MVKISTEMFVCRTVFFFWFFWFLILHSLVFCYVAGRFYLMRKANWRRQSYRTPWRRSLQNTTVSYRQIPPRAKHDGPGEPPARPKTFFAAASSEKHCRSFDFPVPLTTYLKPHTCRLVRAHFDCASFLVSFMKCLLHPRSLSIGHKRFILFFYCYYFI